MELVSGYICPVKPAITNGRLFIRSVNRLLCHELRKPAEPGVDSDNADAAKQKQRSPPTHGSRMMT